ncbi:universal stress protein [Hymenobacter aquaticus]|uniref:Universal stress protein n=1 Tax=Hymenobacter aquaticus TaxID=1867101 RepID=A0A4Z0Q1G0_9BACT|nr:universal stress protein [Hymenobacter aquaticus]TGE23888.1 universal stress protein [Hymenobacter aquaticus]
MAPSLVVLTDFFAVSNRALSYAAQLAVPLGAPLVLLHVRRDGLLAPEEYHARHTRQGESQTTHALQHLAAEQPVPTEVDISDSFLPDAVQQAVRHHHPLLLVLGRPGSATTPQEVITSTAMDLLRNAPYPLLVVPTVGWDSFPPRRFLLAVDGQPFRLCSHQDVIRRLLEATQGTLDIVHVTDEEHARPGAAEVLEEIRANELADELTESQVHDVSQRTAVGGILQEAGRLEADVVVVVARRHSLLGSLFHRSITAQVLQESPIPVLVLPAED